MQTWIKVLPILPWPQQAIEPEPVFRKLIMIVFNVCHVSNCVMKS